MYKAQWSEFEIQCIAFGILRKNLFPDYLVRGEYKFPFCRVDIAIFKPTEDRTNPILKCVVEVKKSTYAKNDTYQIAKYKELLNVPVIIVRGGNEAYKVLDLVKSALI